MPQVIVQTVHDTILVMAQPTPPSAIEVFGSVVLIVFVAVAVFTIGVGLAKLVDG